MKLLLYGMNFHPELTGVGKYTGDLAKYLAFQDHKITIITAPPYYPHWRIVPPYSGARYSSADMDGVKVIRCPLYVPRKPSKFTRLLHLCSFALSSFPVLIKECLRKPDIIIVIEPTFLCTPATVIASKLFRLKTWLHIQDFEIDAVFNLNGVHRPGLLYSTAVWFERLILEQFSSVSSISQSMINLLKSKRILIEKTFLLPNWVDTQFMVPDPKNCYYRDKWHFEQTDRIVLYSGNIGQKQEWGALIHAAKQFQTRPDIKFIIVGEGTYKERLLERCNGLSNILFFPLQPYDHLPELLNMADIHLVLQTAEFADLVMPSKFTGILSCGGYSIVTANEDTELGRICKEHPGIARLVPPDNYDQFVHALEEEISLANNRAPINKIAREYSLKYLEKENILADFEKNLLSLSQSSAAL